MFRIPLFLTNFHVRVIAVLVEKVGNLIRNDIRNCKRKVQSTINVQESGYEDPDQAVQNPLET